MPTSYSDLQVFRNCPRLFGFTKLGYTPPAISEPMQTGTLVHAGIAAHFRGEAANKVIGEEAAAAQSLIDKYLTGDENRNACEKLTTAEKRALELTARYIAHWAKDYRAVLVEMVFELGGVICHPDLLATYQEQRVIVDFKTSYHPDERWYDVSNQCDLYALVVNLLEPNISRVAMIIYDVISEEGLFRHQRPPRGKSGLRTFRAVQALNKAITRVKLPYEVFLDDPHPNYTCPTRCSFFQPCWLCETGTWEDCLDFLNENFLLDK